MKFWVDYSEGFLKICFDCLTIKQIQHIGYEIYHDLYFQYGMEIADEEFRKSEEATRK